MFKKLLQVDAVRRMFTLKNGMIYHVQGNAGHKMHLSLNSLYLLVSHNDAIKSLQSLTHMHQCSAARRENQQKLTQLYGVHIGTEQYSVLAQADHCAHVEHIYRR